MKVLLPSSLDWSGIADEATGPDAGPIDWVVFDVDAPIPEEHLDAQGYVEWGVPREHLQDAATRLTQLRWVQGIAAGPNHLPSMGFAEQAQLCTGVGLHSGPVAEHTLALVLALVRRLPTLIGFQRDHHWHGEWSMAAGMDSSGPSATLSGSTVVVWGFGEIGQRLAPLLTALGAHVVGVARSAGDRGGVQVHEESALPDLLPRADVLVSILPSHPSTEHALDAERIALLKDTAYVVNVGRGSTVDTAALADALREGHIAGAALDVVEGEPLTEDSPWWDVPNLLVTPHVAGGRPLGYAALVADQAGRLARGEELRNHLEH